MWIEQQIQLYSTVYCQYCGRIVHFGPSKKNNISMFWSIFSDFCEAQAFFILTDNENVTISFQSYICIMWVAQRKKWTRMCVFVCMCDRRENHSRPWIEHQQWYAILIVKFQNFLIDFLKFSRVWADSNPQNLQTICYCWCIFSSFSTQLACKPIII